MPSRLKSDRIGLLPTLWSLEPVRTSVSWFVLPVDWAGTRPVLVELYGCIWKTVWPTPEPRSPRTLIQKSAP